MINQPTIVGEGCFSLYDLQQQKFLCELNSERFSRRFTSASTFKIPLSLMAFDQELIDQNTIFEWDGKERGYDFWNQDQTPQTFLSRSVVWVSQSLTPKLGLEKIQSYLEKFNYGNQDFSGDSGKNNGLANAWLSSSLKISAGEQMTFLTTLVTERLPVSQQAMRNTKDNIFLKELKSGWKFYGKTGSGRENDKQIGWFVGFLQKEN